MNMLSKLKCAAAVLCVAVIALCTAGQVQAAHKIKEPPQVIESNNIVYAGFTWWDWPVMPNGRVIAVAKDTELLAESVIGAEKTGTIKGGDQVQIIDTRVKVYPYMGRTKIIAPLKSSWNYTVTEESPKVGDTVYIVYFYPSGMYAIAWYDGKFITLPTDGIKVPGFDSYEKYKLYAEYQGFMSPYDYTGAAPGDPGYGTGKYDHEVKVLNGSYKMTPLPSRRNADMWLKVRSGDGTEGWVQVVDAKLGSAQQNQWWLKYNSLMSGSNPPFWKAEPYTSLQYLTWINADIVDFSNEQYTKKDFFAMRKTR